MLSKAMETIKKYNLIQKKDIILVAVSGGPDSLALLFKLASLRNTLGLTLHIAHLDHGLRKDSKTDALFVKQWADKLDIPIKIEKLDSKIKGIKGSSEEFLREKRLIFLIKTAKKIKANKVALGHNLDDQAETVLMRLLRGTGLCGLSGISPLRTIKGVTFIRPLLETRRREIESFLKQKKVKPRIDPTNREDLFFRNKIRHNLIPLLKRTYNQNIVELLANLAESASYDYEYLDQVAKNNLKTDVGKLNIRKAKKLHLAILRLKIRQSIAYIQGDTRRISFKHIKEVEDLLNNRPEESIVDLPKGISVQKARNFLRFYRR
ncbi:tRNA lysidine(34) synthetase TilS [bacterium]|nr:MAG: tRNA lysidine(34) synthetase TilS [bacterium]